MRRAIFAVAVLAAAMLVPSTGHAALLEPECTLTGITGAGTTCSATFDLGAGDSRFVSAITTHANFHTIGGYGQLKMQWRDAANNGGINGNLVVEYTCRAYGISDGTLDVTRALLCEDTTPSQGDPNEVQKIIAGIQTLFVTATQVNNCAGGCAIHGKLSLHKPGDLY